MQTDKLVEPTGRVVGIIRKNWRPYCGILMASSTPGPARFAVPNRL